MVDDRVYLELEMDSSLTDVTPASDNERKGWQQEYDDGKGESKQEVVPEEIIWRETIRREPKVHGCHGEHDAYRCQKSQERIKSPTAARAGHEEKARRDDEDEIEVAEMGGDVGVSPEKVAIAEHIEHGRSHHNGQVEAVKANSDVQ